MAFLLRQQAVSTFNPEEIKDRYLDQSDKSNRPLMLKSIKDRNAIFETYVKMNNRSYRVLAVVPIDDPFFNSEELIIHLPFSKCKKEFMQIRDSGRAAIN